MKNSQRQEREAVWACNSCGMWWCSQPHATETDFLLAYARQQNGTLSWDTFRGWSIGTEKVGVCPECGAVNEEPFYLALRPVAVNLFKELVDSMALPGVAQTRIAMRA